MKEEIAQVLEMLREGKITNDEAINLIDALKASGLEEANELALVGKRKRLIKINVTKESKPKVNIRVPFGLLRWGLNIAGKLGKDFIKIGGEEIPINMDELNQALNDPEFYGKIIDVYDEEEQEHVLIEVV
ncbi:MAG TPA: hypothetical protein PLT58_05115 [Atribacterota bacterium]|nr:hypothetical protein [Atribacterota bacterium]